MLPRKASANEEKPDGDLGHFDWDELFVQLQKAWLRTLGMVIHPASVEQIDKEKEHNVAVSIAVGGNWSGHIKMSCTEKFASLVTQIMLEIPEEDVTKDDAADAFGELTNILYGKIKEFLPPGTSAGPPQVLDWPAVEPTTAAEVSRVMRLLCRGHLISLWMEAG